ncbi:hypothetical protein [Rubellimicrobium arenae]|uniref:hypothetical protein n=1 Tax=Rubellimicrobium arenae TaxID=2817372 RepID=UPI001B30B6ED|nr:hypothetical protein [Rubellimicrobium arenae]
MSNISNDASGQTLTPIQRLMEQRRSTPSTAPSPLERLVLTSAQRIGEPVAQPEAPAPLELLVLSPAMSVQGGGPVGEPAPAAIGSPAALQVDDATLRKLVDQALRAELQGELGERITRNLRKIVRREVRLALALRDDA